MAGRINIFEYLHGLWKRFKRRHTLGNLHYVESMQNIPDRLTEHVYIVGLQKPKWVIFSCPCGCGERIEVNLMQSRHPRWKMQVTKGVISLWPSLWMVDKKCGSHFWIEKNRVIWVPENYGQRNKKMKN